MTLRKANQFSGSNSQHKQSNLTWDRLENTVWTWQCLKAEDSSSLMNFLIMTGESITELPAAFSTASGNYFWVVTWSGEHFFKF